MRPLLIGGCPGSGKSTVARAVASRVEHSVCIETDLFFDFVQGLIDPSSPEAKSQNHTIVSAYCNAARIYSAGGYAVCLEGVLGPWFLPLVSTELGEFDYILLHVSLPTSRERIASRVGERPVRPSVVDRVHPQFQRVVDDYSAHVIDTESRDVEDVASEIEKKRDTGLCTISAASV